MSPWKKDWEQNISFRRVNIIHYFTRAERSGDAARMMTQIEKGLVIFTFSPRAPRIPAGPWWTHKDICHPPLYTVQLHSEHRLIRFLLLYNDGHCDTVREDKAYRKNVLQPKNTLCPCEEQHFYNNKDLGLYFFLYASLETSSWWFTHFRKTERFNENKKGNIQYFTGDPLSPSKPARPSSP